MKKFSVLHQYSEQPIRKGHHSDLPSLFVPDQTMSIPELLIRYARGLPINGEKTPVYNGETDLPDLNTMDLAEIEDMKNNLQKTIKDTREALTKAEQRKQTKLLEKQLTQKIKNDFSQQTDSKEPKKLNGQKPIELE